MLFALFTVLMQRHYHRYNILTSLSSLSPAFTTTPSHNSTHSKNIHSKNNHEYNGSEHHPDAVASSYGSSHVNVIN